MITLTCDMNRENNTSLYFILLIIFCGVYYFFRGGLNYLKTKESKELYNYSNYWQYDEEYFKKEEILAYLAAKDKEYLSKMGHQFKEMVKSCIFNGVSCR